MRELLRFSVVPVYHHHPLGKPERLIVRAQIRPPGMSGDYVRNVVPHAAPRNGFFRQWTDAERALEEQGARFGGTWAIREYLIRLDRPLGGWAIDVAWLDRHGNRSCVIDDIIRNFDATDRMEVERV